MDAITTLKTFHVSKLTAGLARRITIGALSFQGG